MDIKDTLKKYWPYALGGVVGLYLITRFSGGSSSTDSTGAFYAAQAAAGATQSTNATQLAIAQGQIDSQNAATAIQASLAQAQIDLSKQQLTNEGVVADNSHIENLALLAANVANNNNAAQVNFVASQGQMAQSLGSAATGIISALQSPAIAAINGAYALNASAIDSASTIASNSFLAQADMTKTAGSAVSSAFQAVGQSAQQSTSISMPAAAPQRTGGSGSVFGSAALNNQQSNSNTSSLWSALGSAMGL